MPPTPEPMVIARRLLAALTACEELSLHSFEWIEKLPATVAILEADEPTRVALTRECIDRVGAMAKKVGPLRGQELRYMNLYHEKGYPWEAQLLLPRLLRRKQAWTSDDVTFLVTRLAALPLVCTFALPFLPMLINAVQRWLATGALTPELRTGLERLRVAIERFLKHADRATERRLCTQLAALTARPIPKK